MRPCEVKRNGGNRRKQTGMRVGQKCFYLSCTVYTTRCHRVVIKDRCLIVPSRPSSVTVPAVACIDGLRSLLMYALAAVPVVRIRCTCV